MKISARPVLLALLGLGAAHALAQTPPATDPNGGRRRGGDRPERTAPDGAERGNFNPEDMQARMMSGLRDRMGITNDEEWGLISQRITAVSEARRAAGGGIGGGALGGMFAGRGGPPPGGGERGGPPGAGRGTRTSGNPEMAALQQALADNLPEAEIKSRLDRMREARRAHEAKVTKAQEDLRAVLTVKQEAVAVMFGLLP